jgi:hypothetical protein
VRREKSGARAGERAAGGLEYSGTASFSLLFILLDFFLSFSFRFIFLFVFNTFNRAESLLGQLGSCKSHQGYCSSSSI